MTAANEALCPKFCIFVSQKSNQLQLQRALHSTALVSVRLQDSLLDSDIAVLTVLWYTDHS